MTGGQPLAGRRVLIVEDRFLIACELEDDVRELGGAVAGPVCSVAQAMEVLAHEPVDLALLDVNLEGDFVFPVAEVLSEKGTPFIFLTGYDDWVLPPVWRDRPRLRKPVSPRALRDELAKLV